MLSDVGLYRYRTASCEIKRTVVRRKGLYLAVARGLHANENLIFFQGKKKYKCKPRLKQFI